MTTRPMARVMRTLRTTALHHDGAGLTDGQLLECFLAQRDEAAFEALVRRHGPMVLGTCRRVLGNLPDAEDAFQAAFLVLARKAATVRPREQVGNWLYGVACRTALKARVAAARRRKHERQVTAMPHAEAVAEEQWQELQPILDQELERLPDKYRLPLVLCDLEGRTRRDVARQLGVPDGTLSNRIATARRVLAQRLTKRGITLSGGALAAVLAQNAVSAGVPPALVVSTVQAATGGAAASGVSAGAAALTEGVLKAMLWNKLKPVAVLLILAALAAGVGQAFLRAGAAGPPARALPPVFLAAEPQAEPPTARGRLYYHLGSELVSTQPDGLQKQEHGKNYEQGYQVDSARLSPDGKRLAFGKAVSRKDGLGVHPPDNIYLRDLTKDAKPELLVHLDGQKFVNWVWSPDGAKMAITAWDTQENIRNWIVDVKTKKVEEVKLPRFKFKDLLKDWGEIQMGIEAWSPDGKRFLAVGDGRHGLHLVKTDGSDAKRLTAFPASSFMGHARFSPDGSKVLFVVASREKGYSLYVANVKDGTTKALVEGTNFYTLRACWSPDGKQIAYAVTPKDANGERGEETTLFIMDADGSNTRTVHTEKHGKHGIGLVLTDWR